MDSEWVRLIVSVLSGLAATIPLAIQLVKYVRKLLSSLPVTWNAPRRCSRRVQIGRNGSWLWLRLLPIL